MGRAVTITLAMAAAMAVLAGTPTSAPAASGNTAALQVALRALGFNPGPIDGISGPRTRKATRRLQRRKRLTIDGIAGPRTRRALGRRGRPSFGRRTMRRGNRGWDVAALQFLLERRGFAPQGIDGGFGINTRRAVVRLQRAAGISVDGLVGPATRRALRGRRAYAAPGGPVRFLRPVRGRITDGFGWVGGRRHTGVDFPAPMGAPVGAAGRGVVSFAGWNSGGYGYLVVIRHRMGFESWYAHLSRVVVSAGQAVVGGTRIGYVGSTGRSTGPHLHFEVRRFGTPIDPVPRLLSATAAAGSRARRPGRRLSCRANADAWATRDADPPYARLGRCP